jgi:hypothetical protein
MAVTGEFELQEKERARERERKERGLAICADLICGRHVCFCQHLKM